MSLATDTVASLLAVLDEERAAIRRLDATAVGAAARTKESLAQTLTALSPADLAPIAGDMARLRAELRRNGVLLAHARACLKEVTEISAARRGKNAGTLRARL
jgi:hypothetical protein